MTELLNLLLVFAAASAAGCMGHMLGFARGKLDEIERPRREYEAMMKREEARANEARPG